MHVLNALGGSIHGDMKHIYELRCLLLFRLCCMSRLLLLPLSVAEVWGLLQEPSIQDLNLCTFGSTSTL